MPGLQGTEPGALHREGQSPTSPSPSSRISPDGASPPKTSPFPKEGAGCPPTLRTKAANAGRAEVQLPTPLASPGAIMMHALLGGGYTYALAFLIKHGVSILISLLRRKPSLRVSRDTWQLCNMLGSFSFTWKLLFHALLFYHRRRRSQLAAVKVLTVPSGQDRPPVVRSSSIAGAVAGAVACAFQDPKSRVGYAQQFLIRGLQGYFQLRYKRTGLHVPQVDAALFMLSCGSIMYAYACHPSTIPRAYYAWMINRNCVQGVMNAPVDVATALVTNGTAAPAVEVAMQALQASPLLVPCAVLHPETPCPAYWARLVVHVLSVIAPVYGTLNLVPRLIFKPLTTLKSPLKLLRLAAQNTARSSLFMATFITSYQALMCVYRMLAKRDRKFVYYLFGVVSASSIYLEHQSRRMELALYCLPKAAMSLYLVMLNRGRMVFVPGFDYLLGAVAMGTLMGVYVEEPGCLSPMLHKVLLRLVGPS